MAISVVNLSTGALGGTTTFTTPSLTFQAGKLYLVVIDTYRSDSTNAEVATCSGAGVAWNQDTSLVFDISGAGRATVVAYSGIGVGTTGALTFTVSVAHAGALYSIVEVSGAPATRAEGVRQALSSTGGSTDLAGLVTLSGFANASNMAIGFLAHAQNEVFTPGSGFTKGGEITSASANSLGWEYRLNDNTIDATWSVGARWAMVGYEIVSQTLVTATYAGSISPTGTLGTLAQRLRSYLGGIAPTGALGKQINKALGGRITPTGSLSKTVISGPVITLAMNKPKLVLGGKATLITTDTRPSLGKAQLFIRGKPFVIQPFLGVLLGKPKLILRGKALLLGVSSNILLGKPKLILRGGAFTANQVALVPTQPEVRTLTPTSERLGLLTPTADKPGLLDPTDEEIR